MSTEGEAEVSCEVWVCFALAVVATIATCAAEHAEYIAKCQRAASRSGAEP